MTAASGQDQAESHSVRNVACLLLKICHTAAAIENLNQAVWQICEAITKVMLLLYHVNILLLIIVINSF